MYKGQKSTFFNSIYQMTFFLYAAHEPFMTFLRKLILVIIGTSESSLLTTYFMTATIVIIISICLGLLIKKHFGRVYFLLTGGR